MSDIFQATLSSDNPDLDLTGMQVYEVHGREAISQPYRFTVRSICPFDQTPTMDDLEGASVRLAMVGRGRDRTVRAVVSRVSIRRDLQATVNHIALELSPRLWRSSLVTMQEVYLHTSVPDIIQTKLDRVNLATGTDVFFELNGTYPERHFVVQWRESDLSFVSRLAEHLGVAYYFVQAEVDELHFLDEPAGFPPLGEELPVREAGTEEGVFDLERHRTPVSAFYTAEDYNYERPEIVVHGEHQLTEGFAGAYVEHGPNVYDPEEAAAIARLRAEEQLSRRDTITAASNVLSMTAGRKVELSLEGQGSEEVLITEVEHAAKIGAVLQGTGGDAPSYENRFTAISSSLPYRPPRITAKPRISGLLHGTVVNGPVGIERYAQIDPVGRYWVRMMFDPAPHDSQPSLAVRFMQPHSGPGYGTHFPLKPGIEVLIGFENGDPDRPVIVGSVPNARTPSPVNAGIHTQNRVVTRSGITMDFEDGIGLE